MTCVILINSYDADASEEVRKCEKLFVNKREKDSIRVDLISSENVVSYKTNPPGTKDQPQALFDQISEMIDSAEAKTRDHCVVCGAPGKIDQHKGYALVLCDMHAKLRVSGGKLDIWPKAEDK